MTVNSRLLWGALCCVAAAGWAQDGATDWHGYPRQNFTLAGRPCFITAPRVAAPGKPWAWRTSFPDFHAEVDLELLRSGCHIGYIECLDMLGCDAALDVMDQFYDDATRRRGLSPRPALEGVSRGGLHAYRYAARHPDRVSCVYADTPVMDLKSWPLGRADAQQQVRDALRYYGFKDEADLRAYRGNPVDLLEPIAKAKIPLRHVISLTDVVVPPEQNTLEARRRLGRLGWTLDLVTVAQGTPESGGHHFPLPAVFDSARFVMQHAWVLPAGREYFELRDGLGNSRARFENEKTGRVAFLGGSITFASGWRDEVMRYLEKRFPETKFEFVAAGVPSLGSVPHAFRLERDVLARGPVDLLFVEAAVNDSSNIPDRPDQMLRGMEGVVRHARQANPLTDIVQMHFVMPEHIDDYNHGRTPSSVAQHERVAAHYGNPSLNLSLEVTERIRAGEFTWAADFRDLHPSPFGQQLYANSIARLIDAAWARPPAPVARHVLPAQPLDPRSYVRGRFGPIETAHLTKGFQLVPDWTPGIPRETRPGYGHVSALAATEAGAEFEFGFDGTAAGLMIGAGPDTGIIEVSIDGGAPRTIDTFTPWSKSLYLPWALILEDNLPSGPHQARVRLAADHNPQGAGTALYVFQLLEN
jgi:sialidase-1